MAPFIWGRTARRLGPLGMAGAIGASFVVLVAVFGPLVAPYDPTATNFNLVLVPPLTAHHLLGTDQLGRDVLSRMLYGGRTTLAVGLASARHRAEALISSVRRAPDRQTRTTTSQRSARLARPAA